MAVWDLESTLTHPIDFRIAASGFVNTVWSPSVMAETITSLRNLGYKVVELDALEWTTEERFHDSISTALNFPNYYGRNLDALSDCLGDVAQLAYGWGPTDTGLVIAIHGFDAFYSSNTRAASAVSDDCQGIGRQAALFGNRILTLLNVADPDFSLSQTGTLPIPWLDREFQRSARTPPPS